MAGGYRLKSRQTFGPTAQEQIRRIKAMNGLRWEAGVTGPAASSSYVTREGETLPITVAGLAAIHEHGWGPPQLPKRPFMRETFVQQRQKLVMRGRDTGQAVLEGNGEAAVEAIVEEFVQAIRDLLLGGADLEELSEKTKRKPGRDPRFLPLVDTEQILGALTVTR